MLLSNGIFQDPFLCKAYTLLSYDVKETLMDADFSNVQQKKIGWIITVFHYAPVDTVTLLKFLAD